MFIKKADYQELLHRSKLANEFEAETQQLKEFIAAHTKECKMGIWCKDCVHCGIDYSDASNSDFSYGNYIATEDGCIYYCKKYVLKVCSEFEQIVKENDVKES